MASPAVITHASSVYEFSLDPSHEAKTFAPGKNSCPVLLIAFDTQSVHDSGGMQRGALNVVASDQFEYEWKFSLWRNSHAQLTAEERFPAEQRDGGAESVFALSLQDHWTASAFHSSSPPAQQPEIVVVLLQAVHR